MGFQSVYFQFAITSNDEKIVSAFTRFFQSAFIAKQLKSPTRNILPFAFWLTNLNFLRQLKIQLFLQKLTKFVFIFKMRNFLLDFLLTILIERCYACIVDSTVNFKTMSYKVNVADNIQNVKALWRLRERCNKKFSLFSSFWW